MTSEEIAITLTGHDKEIGSLNHRVEKCENFQKDINNLAMSIHDLAASVTKMCETQEKQEGRLAKLETEPLDNAKYYKRLAIGCVITTIVGAIVGALIGFFVG